MDREHSALAVLPGCHQPDGLCERPGCSAVIAVFIWKILSAPCHCDRETHSPKKKKCLQLPFRTWKWDKFRNILKCQWEYSGTNEIIFSTFYIHFNRHTDRASLMLRLISQLLARFGFRNSRTMVWCSEKNTSSAVHRLEFPSKDLPLNHMSLGCI